MINSLWNILHSCKLLGKRLALNFSVLAQMTNDGLVTKSIIVLAQFGNGFTNIFGQ